MAVSIFWRCVGICVGILAALALVGWIFWNVFNRTTVNLTVRYDPHVQATQATPASASAPAAAPAAPATGTATPAAPLQVSSDTKLIMEAMERMDLRNQAQNANQDRRLDEFGRRLDTLSTDSPTPPTPDCPPGCISGTQYVTPKRN